MTVFRIQTWGEFEARIEALSPATIFYSKDKHPLRKPPIGLRLTFYHEGDTYVLVDFANGATLYKTKIPVHETKAKTEGLLEDDDIKRFLADRFKNIVVSSMGVLTG